jgi:class 3 adenylate cyclase/tetratricopeptide (TPR) repeat protein
MECGTPIEGAAPSAAEPAQPAGAGAHAVAERRVTSVLFGDLVGFTTLSESRDAEDVRELLTQYFELCRTVIGRYGGTVEKFIGDAVMAVWGVPTAHEDDAERAVRAGLEIVESIAAMGADLQAPDLAMRVGVVTGEVAVTIGAAGQGMVAGDAVNTAARVQSAATPRRVWVDETTRLLSSAAISFSDAGEHELKGKAEQVQLWEAGAVIASVGGGQRLDGLEAPLTGRDRELRLVKELFHAAQEAGRPRLVVLDGEPGVGKSRLAWEFEKYIDGLSAPTWWHRGRCLAYGDGVAFWALTEAVRSRLGLVEGDVGPVVAERLDAALERFVGELAERDWLRPRLAVLVGAGGGGFGREELFAAWTAFLEHLAAGAGQDDPAPVIMVIDDAQYADEGLLDFLDHLLANASRAIFVLALARPELLARRHDLGGRRTTVIRLDPLDESAMGRLLDGLVEGLPAGTRAALIDRAEGIPLFAVETIRALIDRDAVIPRGGRYVAADGVEVDLDAIGAPASLQALIAARLDALGPDERRVVTDASVLGTAFTQGGLARLAPEIPDLDGVLASLVRKEIIALTTDRFSAEIGQYRFIQAMVRQVAYATQSRRDRKQRHLAAADYLATEPDAADLAVVIAQHLLDAIDASGANDPDRAGLAERARGLLEAGAARARALGSHTEAQRLLETALARTDASDPVARARLHLTAARAAMDAGDYRTSREHAQEATRTFDDLRMAVEAGEAAGWLASSVAAMGDNRGALEIAQPRWDALQGVPGADRTLLKLAAALSTAHMGMGHVDGLADYADRGILIAEAINDPESLSSFFRQTGARFQTLGAPITAAAHYRGSADIARQFDLPNALAGALINQVSVAFGRDLDAALTIGREAIDAARRSGVQGSIDLATCNYMLSLWTAGRLPEALTLHVAALESVTDPGERVMLTVVRRWLADAVGSTPAGPLGLDSEDSGLSDDQYVLAWSGTLRMGDALERGDSYEAARLAEATLPHALGTMGLEDEFVYLWPPLVLAALADGDCALAEQLMEPVTGAAPGVVSPHVAAHRDRLRGLVGAARGDDPAAVEADLRAGVEGLAAFGAVADAARAEEELARWLIGQDRAEEAEPLLAHVRATYERIGARGWLARMESEVSTGS